MVINMSRKYSPAALMLMAASISQYELADEVGCSAALVSLQLGGHSRLSPELLDAITTFGGTALANKIRRTVHHTVTANA